MPTKQDSRTVTFEPIPVFSSSPGPFSREFTIVTGCAVMTCTAGVAASVLCQLPVYVPPLLITSGPLNTALDEQSCAAAGTPNPPTTIHTAVTTQILSRSVRLRAPFGMRAALYGTAARRYR